MRTTQSLKLLFISFILATITGCASYSVDATDGGYRIGDIPAEVLAEFPAAHRIELTLDDPELGQTSVVGLATISGKNSLNIQTGERFKFSPKANSTWLLLRSREGTVTAAKWSGCIRAPSLRAHGGNQKLCWCWSDRIASN